MRRSVLLISAFVTVASACGGASRSDNVAGVAANANSNVSFGLYDISRSSPYEVVRDVLASKPESDLQLSRPLLQAVDLPANQSSTSTNNKPLLSIDRKVVRNAELDLESESPERSQQKITSVAEANGGFVVESNQSSSDIQIATRDIVTMTIRVPSERFETALDDVRKAADRIVAENVKGLDVTEEFIDIEARLKAKKALEAQFMDIMKRASSIEEAMNVQAQLADVRAEIEKIEGRKRFLENQSSLSTIKVRVQTPKVFAAASQGFGGRLAESFEAGFNVATNFVLGLLTFVIAILPFALLIGLPSVLAFRYFWKRQSRPKSVSEIAREEIT